MRERRLRRRSRGRARRAAAPAFPSRLDAPEEVATPGQRRRSRLSRRPRDRRGGDVEGDAGDEADGTLVLALVAATTGSTRRSSQRARARFGQRPTTRSAPRSAPTPGSLGPVGFGGEVVADDALREGQFVAGANRTGWHLRGVVPAATSSREFADIRAARRRATRCPRCGGALRFQTAIEVGHIFKLGTRYSEPLERDVPRRGRHRAADRHGELRHRPRPRSSRPRSSSTTTTTASSGRRPSLRTTSTSSRCPGVEERARGRPRTSSRGAGFDVLLDDRDRRAGREVRRRRSDRAARSASRWGRRRSRTERSTSASGRPARSGV